MASTGLACSRSRSPSPTVWSAIDSKPKRVPPERLARVRFLRRKPSAALTVDRYDDDWTRLAWVQVLGDVRIVDAGDAPEAIAALRAQVRPVPRRAAGRPAAGARSRALPVLARLGDL